jgi:hypothetical protein
VVSDPRPRLDGGDRQVHTVLGHGTAGRVQRVTAVGAAVQIPDMP